MIYGTRIRFRGIEKEDIPLLVEWFNDPEVLQGLGLHCPISRWSEENWFDALDQRSPEERPFLIEARDGDAWIPIGDCGYQNVDWWNRSAELGIAIGNKSYWNQGYGTETMRLLLRFGFETLNLHRIYLRVHETNRRAIRAYENAGFVHEGRMREAVYSDGQYEALLCMSVLRSEWNFPEKEEEA
jgi:RimJ/RimL family protein N-acetyltransferase